MEDERDRELARLRARIHELESERTASTAHTQSHVDSLTRARQMLFANERLAKAGAFIWDAEFDRISLSEGMKQITAPDDPPLGQSKALSLVHPDDRKRLVRLIKLAIRGTEVLPTGFRAIRSDGTILHLVGRIAAVLDDDQNLVSLNGALMDVTERRHLEAQLLQSQKMEAIGTLAGGVAHDFNNFLQVIAGHCDLLQLGGDLSTRARSSIDEISSAITRCQELTQKLLAFGRKQDSTPSLNDVRTLVTSTVRMLNRLLGDDVELAINNDDLPCVVRIDPLQFEQVLVNLAINARDAMPNGGSLEVSVRQTFLDATEAKRCGLQPGTYCHVVVRDTGVGMRQDVAERIFEPFFTTKPLGAGTGLGLSTVHGIVHQGNGAITVASTEGVGTAFTLYFPLTQSEQSLPAVQASMGEGPGGSETILLAEDGHQVRSVTQRQLERAGYSVLAAEDGERALDLARRHAGPVHLLISDVMMPRMNGPELAQELAKLHPNAKVLFMSGYTERMVMQRAALHRERVQLHKPFSMHELLTSVRDRLDQD